MCTCTPVNACSHKYCSFGNNQQYVISISSTSAVLILCTALLMQTVLIKQHMYEILILVE